jgi:hypothetical protein
MQIFMVKKDSNVQALLAGTSKTQVLQLQKLNPHLDFKRIKPGEMIIVPDSVDDVDFPGGSLKTIGADAMESFSSFAEQALADAARRMKTAADRAKTEEASLATALKSRMVTAALSQDPELKSQAAEASTQAKADSKAAAADVKAFDQLRKTVMAELAVLEKRLR